MTPLLWGLATIVPLLLVGGMILTAVLVRRHDSQQTYLRRGDFQRWANETRYSFDQMKTTIADQEEQVTALQQEIERLTGLQAATEEGLQSLETAALPGVEQKLTAAQGELDTLHAWAKRLAQSSRVLLNLEPALRHYLENTATDGVSPDERSRRARRAGAQLAALRAWHAEQPPDDGIHDFPALVETLEHLAGILTDTEARR